MLFLVACVTLFVGAFAQYLARYGGILQPSFCHEYTRLTTDTSQFQWIDLRPYNLTAAIMFVNNDLNNDGFLTAHEFDQVFAVYDFNDDKIIERHEYVCYITRSNSHMGHLAQALYDEYDSDNDHRLEVHDFDTFYKKMDEDGNHIVTDLEFVRYWEMLLLRKEEFSLGGGKHETHTDSYCVDHGHAHG